MGMRFAVAAGDPLTASAAAEVLRAGGNAVDAAIAGALVACVAEPVLAGLLGGGFLTLRAADGECSVLDFFVQTPRRKRPMGEIDFREIEADFGETTQMFHIGAGSMATPGVARGLAEAHARAGRMPFAELAAPAVEAARKGVALTTFQAGALGIIEAICTATPAAAALFGDGTRILKAGEVYRNPNLADVIETYAREGDRFIHEGEVAAALLSLDGGHLGRDDLARYQARWRQPVMRERHGARLALNPPPSLGGTLIAFALALMDRGATPADCARAFAATSRARLAVDLNRDGPGGALRLADPELVARYRREVAMAKVATRGTTHVSVIDAAGMGAALTLSNGEGCGLIAPGTGVMPNNMLGEEDLMPGDWDEWTPDARLASMMAPMAMDWPDGRVAMLGSGGSNRIRTALAQVAAKLADGDARLEDAVAAPRVHVEKTDPPRCDFEDRLSEGDREALLAAFPEAKGWARDSMFFGGVHAVRRSATGDTEAAADHRREGVALTS